MALLLWVCSAAAGVVVAVAAVVAAMIEVHQVLLSAYDSKWLLYTRSPTLEQMRVHFMLSSPRHLTHLTNEMACSEFVFDSISSFVLCPITSGSL